MLFLEQEQNLAVPGVCLNTPFVLILICIPLFLKTWEDQKSFADGPSILKYINEAADEYKVRDHIIYQQCSSYNFDTKKLWTVTTVNATAEETVYTCQFIFSCRLL
jgi:cation diffusion facilitator CzcD-associated flavoprotein CzcO